jgi:hypothetical protein
MARRLTTTATKRYRSNENTVENDFFFASARRSNEGWKGCYSSTFIKLSNLVIFASAGKSYNVVKVVCLFNVETRGNHCYR